jgi:hypothetical protein
LGLIQGRVVAIEMLPWDAEGEKVGLIAAYMPHGSDQAAEINRCWDAIRQQLLEWHRAHRMLLLMGDLNAAMLSFELGFLCSHYIAQNGPLLPSMPWEVFPTKAVCSSRIPKRHGVFSLSAVAYPVGI